MWNIGPTQLLIVLIIILVLFGGKKLPDLARSLGRSLGEFKKGREEGEDLAESKVKDLVNDIKSADTVPKVETAQKSEEEKVETKDKEASKQA